MKPQQVAQYQKRGRGYLITRNSACLADTDYEHVAKEIVDALNKHHAYEKLVEAVRCAALTFDIAKPEGMRRQVETLRALLHEIGEAQ